MDNYFTSIPLAKELLEQKMTIVGTLLQNKKDIPPLFLDTKIRPPCSSMFGFSKSGVLTSYIPRCNKKVLVLSSMHSDGKIDEETGEKRKPEIVTFYNVAKEGVDVIDELKVQYSVSRISCRWPLTVFFPSNIADLNSQITFIENNNEAMVRRTYLKNLALALMKLH
ncbi:hypothetical protein PR048_009295 [Dryococelus australis]|uniref:PiggyBac transposable element-derived protein domain-containing protein n=1 Tax=Dryococelus australis TaxID=614101 RepID=A0ABQ9HZV4_9NEOP|nr:hypothetical protein PR048_009295 [Dryococelus australis]